MKRKLKKAVAVILTAAMTMSVGMPAFAAGEDNMIDESMYPSIPIFGTLDVNGVDLFESNNVLANQEGLTEKETGRIVLESVLDYQAAGGFVTWNELGVETVVKNWYPDLYAVITTDMSTNDEISIPMDELANKARGNMGDTFGYIHRGYAGEKLYGVSVTVNWEWNDTTGVLTYIGPSTSVNSYDILWDPVGNGINKSAGYFNNGKTVYTHTSEGIFSFAYDAIEYYAYPYVEVTLSANSGIITKSGVTNLEEEY